MTRPRRMILATVTMLALTACGGSDAPGGGNGGDVPGGEPGATFTDRLTVTAADERTPHGLQQGRYRLDWSADCSRPAITITPAEGGEPVYSATPSIRFVLVNSLDAGVYFVELAGEDCGDWEVSLAAL